LRRGLAATCWFSATPTGPWVSEYGGVLFVNCGSVGKPKDGDPRAGFAVLSAANDEFDARIERVDYDAESAASGIAAAGLPNEYGDKLVSAS
jgi:diadenosine tetraphosphatase ApaH/serine/threonine PP2A family protein phosphatase